MSGAVRLPAGPYTSAPERGPDRRLFQVDEVRHGDGRPGRSFRRVAPAPATEPEADVPVILVVSCHLPTRDVPGWCPRTPEVRYAAPFWPWYAEATLRTSGVTAAEAVVDEGLRHWPSHPDLHHFRIGLNMIRFARAAMDETSMAGVPMASRRCLEGIEAAGTALKLPIHMRLKRQEQQA